MNASPREGARVLACGQDLSASIEFRREHFHVIARFARPPHPANVYVSVMKRRWVFRAARWAGRVIGVTGVLAIAWLCLRWTQAHWWLQTLLTLWSLTFVPAGWVGGSMIAHWIVRRICRSVTVSRTHRLW